MDKLVAVSGNSGPKVRSDCEITIQLKNSGGLLVDVESRVKVLYGESIIKICREILHFYGIRNASVKISDSGALPFVIAARAETAIKKLIDTDLEYLPG